MPSWFPVLLWGLQLSDQMNLRRDFELLTLLMLLEIMGTLEVGLNVLFNYAMATYGPHRLMCLNKPMGIREWNVMVCI